MPVTYRHVPGMRKLMPALAGEGPSRLVTALPSPAVAGNLPVSVAVFRQIGGPGVGFGEKITRKGGTYYRARYKIEGRTFGTVRSPDGSVAKYRTRAEAARAASDAEAALRSGRQPAGTAAPAALTFGQWANRWYAGLDLAASTMTHYRRHIETHLLPAFGDAPLASVTAADVDAWEKAERAAGYAPASVKAWRAVLHACMADAVPALIPANPVTRRRGRGKRTGRHAGDAPEKVITDPLGALLAAERAAILSGRDDEFAMITLAYWTGMRWGELAGLEREYARPGKIRAEWQLYELSGRLARCPPKDGSRRDIALPPFLGGLLAGQLARVPAAPCACHGRAYVFSGRTGPHHLRTGFAAWIFGPAVSGWYRPKAGYPARPVPLLADPWPGVPARGRGNEARADACWVPLAPGMTPHGLRHSHKSLMAELRTPEVLSHDRLGHEMGGMAGVYSHVTPAMVTELMDGLTRRWLEALDARLAMCPRSPVAVLDGLLAGRAAELAGAGDSKIITRISPVSPARYLRALP